MFGWFGLYECVGSGDLKRYNNMVLGISISLFIYHCNTFVDVIQNRAHRCQKEARN